MHLTRVSILFLSFLSLYCIGEIPLYASKKNQNHTDSNIVASGITNDSTLNREPVFPGGIDSMEVFIKKTLRYPKKAIKVGAEGRVLLRLTISEEGEISQISILRGIYPPCDEEAIYVAKLMPKWIPGLRNGKTVTMQTIVPVPFEAPKN